MLMYTSYYNGLTMFRHISSENNHLIDICPVAYTEDRLVDNWPADSRKQWPEWLGPAVDALEKLCESAPWRQAVWTWICFEELMNYPVGQVCIFHDLIERLHSHTRCVDAE